VLSGEYLTTIFDNHTDYVRQFQIIQKKDNSITLNVVFTGTDASENMKILKDVESSLSRRIRNQVPLVVNILDHIDTQRGKLQYIIKEN
jgi:hypothetical protein